MQRAIRRAGPRIAFYRAGSATPLYVRARVRWLNATELTNAIEAYALVVTCTARDFDASPSKGDEFLVEGARRAILQVREIRWLDGVLIAYQCGVQG